MADADTGETRPVIQESDPCWINVCEDLVFFQRNPFFLWTSEKDSYRQIYLYDGTGRATQLTSGDEAAVAIVALDEKNSTVYYQAYPAAGSIVM